MVALFLQLIHAVEGISNAQCQLTWADVTQIVGGECREQEQTDVCWRGTVRYDSSRFFLKMIGWKPLIIRAYKMLKVQPGSACQEMQLFFLRRSKFFRPVRETATDPGSYIRR